MIDNFKNIKESIEYPREGILSKSIIKNEKIDLTLFCMAKSSEISEHTSIREGIVYVIEGKGVFNLKGEKIPMVAGVLIHLKKNVVHSINAEENTSFVLSLFK